MFHKLGPVKHDIAYGITTTINIEISSDFLSHKAIFDGCVV